MKKFILLAAVLTSFFSFAYDFEYDGFRGAKWETNIKALKGLDLIVVTNSLKGMETVNFYFAKKLKPFIGQLAIIDNAYGFSKDKLVCVALTFKRSSSSSLKSILKQKFKTPDFEDSSMIMWISKDTVITLNINSQNCLCSFISISYINKKGKKKNNISKANTSFLETDF